jgi:hypothetical protein
MDIVPHADLPGASFDFQDARRLFVDAAARECLLYFSEFCT